MGGDRPSPAAAPARRSRGARAAPALRPRALIVIDAEGGRVVPPAGGGRGALLLLPLLLFLVLAGLFYARLGAGDPSALPSALIGRPAPTDDLGPLEGLQRDGQAVPGLPGGAFRDGRVTI